jgi:hypothetical protein
VEFHKTTRLEDIEAECAHHVRRVQILMRCSKTSLGSANQSR